MDKRRNADEDQVPMSQPRYEQKATSFFGEPRKVTRHVLYRSDDADYDPALHSLDVDSGNDDEEENPDAQFAEAGFTETLEDPAAVSQFRADLNNADFRKAVQEKWRLKVPMPPERFKILASVRERQVAAANEMRTTFCLRKSSTKTNPQAGTRSEIVRAMEASHVNKSIFSIDYARNIPPVYRTEFLQGTEANSVCAILIPMLFCTPKYHLTENQLRLVMFDAGCAFEGGENVSLHGHMRLHVPAPPKEGSFYGDAVLDDSIHTHFNKATNSSVMRILTFQIPTQVAATPTAMARATADAEGYRVKVVCHAVGGGEGGKEKDEKNIILCFRTFYFSRFN